MLMCVVSVTVAGLSMLYVSMERAAVKPMTVAHTPHSTCLTTALLTHIPHYHNYRRWHSPATSVIGNMYVLGPSQIFSPAVSLLDSRNIPELGC